MRVQRITVAAPTLAAASRSPPARGTRTPPRTRTTPPPPPFPRARPPPAGPSGGSGASDENTTITGGGPATAQGSGDGKITTGPRKTADLDFNASHGMAEGDLIVSPKTTGGDACSVVMPLHATCPQDTHHGNSDTHPFPTLSPDRATTTVTERLDLLRTGPLRTGPLQSLVHHEEHIHDQSTS